MQAGTFDFMKTELKGVLDEIIELRERGLLTAWAKQMSEAIVSGFKMAAEAARLFGTVVAKVATLHDQFWGIVPEALGGGKSKMSIYEDKLDEYNKLTRLLADEVALQVAFPKSSAFDREIEYLQNRLKVIKAALDFLDGQLGITLPAFPDTGGKMDAHVKAY